MTAPKLADQLAAKLDASDHVVWNWRSLWRAYSVRLNALGAFLTLSIGAAIWISPLLGILWVSWQFGPALIATGVLFTMALLARFLTQPQVPDSTPPEADDDDTNHA